MMSNWEERMVDKASILKDISDRTQIIQNYERTGHLERDEAISKIQELRLRDKDVAIITSAKLTVSATPFSQTPDQAIVAELQMQIEILTAKLVMLA